MNPQPLHVVPGVQPLSRRKRRLISLSLVAFFFCAVPIFVFYATGYRYNFLAANPSITTTGGLYLTIGEGDGEVFLNDTQVYDLRVFSNAVFIQNLIPGMQRLHVQEPEMHTWVKVLPVYPYIVTEAESFALPLRPQVRPVSEYETATGTQIIVGTSTLSGLFTGVSTSIAYIATTSNATTTLVRNAEYEFLVSLFSTTTATSTSLLKRAAAEVTEAFTFTGSKQTGASATTSDTLATTTKLQDGLKLYQEAGEVYVDYTGNERSIPYYFCVPQAALASTSELYGAQVMMGVALVLAERPEITETANQARICRSSIKIDRGAQTVVSFDFFPSTTNLIVLHRSDGIYVTEVDDRSWQNTQALYPFSVDEMVLSNGKIYVKRGEVILELLIAIPASA